MPIVAPSGISDAAASVGETDADSSVLAADAASGADTPLSPERTKVWNFTCERLAMRLSWTISEGVSSSPGTALPRETSCW